MKQAADGMPHDCDFRFCRIHGMLAYWVYGINGIALIHQ